MLWREELAMCAWRAAGETRVVHIVRTIRLDALEHFYSAAERHGSWRMIDRRSDIGTQSRAGRGADWRLAASWGVG